MGFGVTQAKYAENRWFCPENGAKMLLKSSLLRTFLPVFELIFPIMPQSSNKIRTNFILTFPQFFTQAGTVKAILVLVFAEMRLKSQIEILVGFGVTKTKYAENRWFSPENGGKMLAKSTLLRTFSRVFELISPHKALKFQ